MSLPRIFIATKLALQQKVTLDLAASNHLLHVLKLKVNDSLMLFNDTGNEFQANIMTIIKQQAIVTIEKRAQRNNESPLKIHLGQGISRGEKMDFTVQKAVELGVTTITPVFTQYCNVKLEKERLEKRLRHWQKIAISAAEQSGRCYVPKILITQTLEAWLPTICSNLRLVLDPCASNKIADIEKQSGDITILIGPEGGLSPNEINLAKNNGFLPIKLGPRILRTETAALATISALQTKWGDF